MVNVADTSLSKSEFMNRRLHPSQGRRRSRHNTLQMNAKKSVGVVTDRRGNALIGDKENSVFDRYQGVFGYCDGRGKRVIKN